jgi:hypothetical protein
MSCLPKWCTIRRRHTKKEKANAIAKKQHEYSLMNEENNDSHPNHPNHARVPQTLNTTNDSCAPMLHI